MAARGAESKEEVANIILQTFPAAFKYEKEIRIPMMENGELIQIKVTLTAAKTNVEIGEDTALPGADAIDLSNLATSAEPAELKQDAVYIEPTAEEKENVKSFLGLLGL